MRGKTFNLATAASLVVCAAVLLLWARSYFAADAIGYAGKLHAVELTFAEGRVLVWCWATQDPTFAATAWWPGFRYVATDPRGSFAYRLPGGEITSGFSEAGVTCLHHRLPRGPWTDSIWYFHMPAWLVAVVAAVLPACWVIRRRGQRAVDAQRLGLCPSCGYDLPATAERCHACGREVDSPAAVPGTL